MVLPGTAFFVISIPFSGLTMARPQLQISIPQPCSENWAAMSPQGQGRFCAACATTVTDFSRFTDKQLLEYFASHSGKTCGRFSANQLNRPVYQETLPQPKFFPRAIAAVALFLGVASQTQAQKMYDHPTPSSAIETPEKPAPEKTVLKTPEKAGGEKLVISGRVIDSQTKEPLAFCAVAIKDTRIFAQTGIDATFKISLPDTFLLGKFSIVTQYVGYKPSEFQIDRQDLPQVREIEMVQNADFATAIVGAVVIVESKPRYYLRVGWWRFKNLFRKKDYGNSEE
jgi:hypothetical protein